MKYDNTLIILMTKKTNDIIKLFEHKLNELKLHNIVVCDDCTLLEDYVIKNQGYYNLTRSPHIKKPSAWDKAFYRINSDRLLNKYDYFFFIEDDVYSKDYDLLIKFIIESISFDEDLITKEIRPRSHHPTWKYWKEEYINKLTYPHQSFNPLCRISKRLIETIIEYKENNGKFEFHEILFSSLCLENNLSYINYIKNETLKKYIGNIICNPIFTSDDISDNLIYHPVKKTKKERILTAPPVDDTMQVSDKKEEVND